jgi:hypothetical protein
MRSESTVLFSADDIEGFRQALSGFRARFLGWRRRRLGLRGMLLYVAGAPLLLAGPLALGFGRLTEAVVSLAAFGLVAVSATMNRRGLLEKRLSPERRYTQTTRIPHQHLAMLPLAAAVFLVAHSVVGQGVVVSIAYAALALIGFALAYQPGLPRPWRSGPAVRIDDPAMRRALQQAERQLLSIEAAALHIGNEELDQRLRRIVDQGRTVLSMLADNPSDLFRARQFLNVHLDGAERVARRYAKTHRLARGGRLEQSFRSVLVQIEKAIEQQRRQLLNRDAFDLDVQIAALKKQLDRQGID